MSRTRIIYTLLLLSGMTLYNALQAQVTDTVRIPPMPTMKEIMKDWGPNDSVAVAAIWYGDDYNNFKMLPYKQEEMIWVSKLPPQKLAKVVQEWTRLRNAVYVCYPYAKTAGHTINAINKQMEGVTEKSARKKIIKSKEKELKKQFSDPLSNLSVYQGKVLMKLINRQTGNNCYEIIKEYKGGLNARMYQTVAFFYGSSLKQDYDMKESFDYQIELIVKEIDGAWYNNPFRTK